MLPGPLHDSLSEHAMISGANDTGPGPSLLVVDSDREMRRTLVSFFEKRGFHVVAAASLAGAKQGFATTGTWALVIADCHLPDGTGQDLRAWVRERVPGTTVLLMSGSAYGASLCDGEDFLAKPFRLEKLEAYISTVLQGA